MNARFWILLGAVGVAMIACAPAARAQFSNPTTPPSIPNPVQTGLNRLPSNVVSEDIQKIMLLRALQQRAGGGGGGVRTGVPQFIPFGNNFMPNAQPAQQLPAAGGAVDDDKGKSNAEKRAEYEAAREERKRKSRERAEKRKAERAQAQANP